LLIIGPDPLFHSSAQTNGPQPRIDFSYFEISGPDICSIICGLFVCPSKFKINSYLLLFYNALLTLSVSIILLCNDTYLQPI
jgi:hypothetical protein